MEIKIPYKPRPWQQQLHNITKRFNVIVAHRGSGKSIYSMNEVIKQALIGPALAQYAYILPQLTMGRRNVWDAWKYFSSAVPETRFNNTLMETRFPNESRVHILGADDPDALRGLHLHGVVLDEYSDMHADTWKVVRPMLTNHKGWVIWIGTPKGRNSFYDMYMRSQEPDRPSWFGVIMPWFKTNALSLEEVEQARSEMSPEEFAQELECSFDAALVGAFYARQLSELRENGRISYTPIYRPDLEVHVAFDLGIRDQMACWWFQLVGNDINFIDYEQHSNFGFPEWATILKNKPYRYGTYIAPHDIRVRELGAGISRLEAAENLGIPFEICPKHDVMDGIEAVRRTLPRCRFAMSECADGVDMLGMYRSKTDKAGNPIGPEHSAASHCADSLRYAIIYATQVMTEPQMMRVPLNFRR